MRKVVALVALVSALAACGGGGTGDATVPLGPPDVLGNVPAVLSDAEVADAVATAALARDSVIRTEAEATCFGEAVVAGVGGPRLAALGLESAATADVATLAFDPAEIAVVVDAMTACADVKGALEEAYTAQYGSAAGCILDGVDDELLDELLTISVGVSSTGPDPALFERFESVVADCGSSSR